MAASTTSELFSQSRTAEVYVAPSNCDFLLKTNRIKLCFGRLRTCSVQVLKEVVVSNRLVCGRYSKETIPAYRTYRTQRPEDNKLFLPTRPFLHQ